MSRAGPDWEKATRWAGRRSAASRAAARPGLLGEIEPAGRGRDEARVAPVRDPDLAHAQKGCHERAQHRGGDSRNGVRGGRSGAGSCPRLKRCAWTNGVSSTVAACHAPAGIDAQGRFERRLLGRDRGQGLRQQLAQCGPARMMGPRCGQAQEGREAAALPIEQGVGQLAGRSIRRRPGRPRSRRWPRRRGRLRARHLGRSRAGHRRRCRPRPRPRGGPGPRHRGAGPGRR